MSVNKNIFYTFLTQIPTMLLGICSGIFITRIIGPRGTGVYTIFQADIDFLILLFVFGLDSALIYFTSSKKIAIEKLIGISLYLIGISSFLVLVCLLCLYGSASTFVFPLDYSHFIYAVYLLVAFVFALFNSLMSSLFRGKSMFREINRIVLFNSIFNIVLYGIAFVLYHFIHLPVTINHIFIISLGSLTFNSAIWLYLYVIRIGVIPSFNFSFQSEIKPISKYVTFAYISHIVNFMNYRLDVWIVNHYCGEEQVGYYAKAVGVAQMFWIISNSISTVLLPYLADPLKNDTNNIFKFFSKINFTAVAILMLIAASVSPIVFPLVYGHLFVNSVIPFLILLPGILFTCITSIFAVYLLAKNKIEYNLIATIIGVVFTISLDFILIPRYGIKGAGFASVVSYFSVLLTVSYCLIYKLELKLGNYFVITNSDIRELKNKFNKYFTRNEH